MESEATTGCQICKFGCIYSSCGKGKTVCSRCRKSARSCRECLQRLRHVKSNSRDPLPPGPSKSTLRTTEPRNSSSGALGEPREFGFQAPKEILAFTYLFSTYGWANFSRPFLEPGVFDSPTTLASICGRALAFGIFGHDQKYEELWIEAGELYGSALAILAKRIPSVSRKDAAQLVVPVITLIMYSTSVDRARAFLSTPGDHYVGLKRILEYCGPEQFREQPLLAIFESSRAALVNDALIFRKRLFLEEKQWSNIPWRFSSNKSAANQVLDILVDIPGIIQNVETMQPMDYIAKELLKVRINGLMSRLEDWRWVWDAANRDAVREVPSKTSPSGIQHPIFQALTSTVLHFDSVTLVGDILIYNTALLWLMRLQSVLFSMAMEPSNDDDIKWIQTATMQHPSQPLLLPGEARFFLQPAIETCRSMEYLIANLMTSQDVILGLLMPVAVAYSFIKEDEMLTAWLRAMLDTVPWAKEIFSEMHLIEYDTTLYFKETWT